MSEWQASPALNVFRESVLAGGFPGTLIGTGHRSDRWWILQLNYGYTITEVSGFFSLFELELSERLSQGPRLSQWIIRQMLTDLQSEKALLERDAAALHQSLHELHQAGREHMLSANVWQAEFARQNEKLVIVAGKIGGLDKRILALVEG
jgi:hypothetical protein